MDAPTKHSVLVDNCVVARLESVVVTGIFHQIGGKK